MLSLSLRSTRLACGICIVMYLHASVLCGQDATPAAAASPSDVAAAAPAAEAAPAAKKEPVAKVPPVAPKKKASVAVLPLFDYSRLAHPSVADQLELTDQQRAGVAQLINQRATQLAAAPAEKRKAILAAADQKLAALLSEYQRAKLATLVVEKKLQFNFRDQKWADVLDWFARQAGLALVMDKSPPGAFTYTNNRSYSPTEAIDLLNSVLLTKGFSLLRRGRMLILVDLSDDLPGNLIPRVPDDEIDQHGDFEIIRVLFPLAGRPADAVAKEIQPLVGKYGSCVGLPQTGQLLVTETAGKLKAIGILIASIPKPPKKEEKKKEKPAPPPAVLGVYPVKVVKPAAAVETLGILFPSATFTVDDKADQVMAYARPKEQEAIKAAVAQMEANRPPEKQPRLEVYRIDLPETEKLVEQLQIAMPEIQATIDSTSGRLLVFATPEDQATVKEMIEKLGGSVDASIQQVVVYQPKHFDPTALAALIENLAPRAKVSTDAQLRRVVVSASPAEQTMIKSLVEQLDQESALEDRPVLQIHALDKPVDATLVTTLQGLVPDATITLSTDAMQLSVVARVVDQTVIKKMVDQWKEVSSAQSEPELKIYPLEKTLAATDLATIKSLVPGAQVTLSTNSRQLVVIARDVDQTAVQTLVQRLSDAASAQPKPELKVYPLAHRLAAADVTNLTTLVPGAKITLAADGRQLKVLALADEHQDLEERIKQLEAIAAAQPKAELKVYPLAHQLAVADVASLTALVPGAKITLAPDGRQLRVVALPSDHQELETRIKQFEAAAAAEVKPEMAVFALRRPLSTTVMATLQSLVPQAKMTLSTDARELIVVARSDAQAVIKKTLDQIALSAGAVGDQQLEIYQLDGLPAAELQQLLQPLAVHSTITVDVPQDRLIVWGPAAEHAAFATVISKLAADPLVGTKPLLKFYPLADLTQFTSISSILASLVPTAKMTWDEDTKRALVIATPKDHQRVQQAIDQVVENAAPVEQQVLRLYSLLPIQQTRFEAVQADVLQSLPGMRVIKDPQTGELAVWAKPSQQTKLTEILDQLKVEGQSTGTKLLISYPINSSSPETAFEMLQQMFPGIKFSLDAKASRILVYASLKEQGRIKQTLSQLDIEGAPSNKEELRSYSTGDVNPATLVTMLQVLVPDMQLTADAAAKKLMALGTSRDHDVLAKAIEQVRSGDAEDRPFVRAYPLEGRDVSALIYMRIVLLQMVPDAAITVDPRGNSIVASATAEDHKRLKEAIDEIVKLDSNDNMKLETYSLDKLTAAQVTQTLRPIVPSAQISPGVDPQQVVVWATAADHERVVAALAKLEEAAGGETERVLQLHRVRPAVAAQATAFIARTLPNVQLLSGQGTNQILVWGTPKDQQRLAKLIEQMESELGADADRKMITYELGDVDPAEARRVLDSAIGGLEYVSGKAADALVVWADEETHVAVAKLLDELKSVVATPRQTLKVYPFEVGELDVTTVFNALSPEDTKELTIQLNTVTNSLIVRGPADRQVELEETIANLVDQLPVAEKTTAVVYRLDRAEPNAASLLLRSLLPSVPVAIDVANRTLAVTATAKDHAKVREVLDQLDNKDGGDLLTETYVMKRGNPTAVMTALKPIVPRAIISADVYNKMLIVTATAEEQKQIKAIVEQADGEGNGVMSTKAYPLKYANAYTITTALTKVVPAATVSADALNKMLIVTANEEDHKRILAVLDQADKRGGGELQTKAYVLQLANPSAIAVALRAVVPNATVSADALNKMLVVTASEEDQQRVKTIVDEADRRGEGEVTTEVYALKFANPLALSYSIKPIAPNATASPDVYNKTLIVTATAKDHERIKAIIDQADKRGGGDLTTKAYSVKWANAATIATALTAVVPDAKISSDVTNRMLIVTANKEDHAKIQEVLEQADKRGGGELVTHAYTLQTANPTTIMLALRPVVPDATVSSDVTNKMIVVTASEEDHKKVAAIVDEADHREDGDLVTEVYTLKWANPTALSSSLRPIAPNAVISPDVYNKSLFVTATAKDHLRIKAVVEQADQRGGGELTTQAYSLKWANPITIATALTAVVPDAKISSDTVNKMLVVTANKEDHEKIKTVIEQADQRGGGELVTKAYVLQLANPSTISVALRTVVPNATVSADVTNKMLVVTASAEDQQRIQTIVDEADRRGEGEMTTQVYALKFANPTALSYSIKPIAPNATASPDVYNKTLIVTATAKDHERIKAVIDQADRRGGGDLTTKAYALKWANPTTIATALTAVVPNATVSSDVGNKMLVVTANKEDHAIIQGVLDQADERGGGNLETRAYPLRTASPATIMVALRPVVPDATISADTLNRMLIATASEEDHLRIKTIVEAADRRGDGEMVTEAYSLKWANPSTLMVALRPVVPNATVGADTANKTLIVTASAADQTLVKKVVDQADRRGEGEMTTEVYLLTRANPLYVQRALLPLVPEATIGADAASKILIITAPEKEQEKIKKIVERADRRGEGDLVTKVYPFKLANPTTVALALKTLIPNALMSADKSTNTLIVTGTVEDQQQVEPLVKQLDVAAPTTRVVVPYAVENADPREVYTSLTQLFRYNRDVSVGYQQDTGMILVFATPVDQDAVGSAITEIDKATAGRPKATLEVYQLEGLDGTAAVDTLTELLKNETPKVDLQVDDGNNQVLAIANPEQQEMIRKALAQLKPIERDVEVYTLERVDPFTAESAIDTLFTDMPYAAMPSVEADPDTQQLIVRATKTQLDQIRKLLDKMGEGVVRKPNGQSTSMLRVIPLIGDTEATLREIERVWPQVRGNKMQIISPPKASSQPSSRSLTPPAEAKGSERKAAEEGAARDAPGDPKAKTPGNAKKSASVRFTPAMFVSAQSPQSPAEQAPAEQAPETRAQIGPSAVPPATLRGVSPTQDPSPKQDPVASAVRSAPVSQPVNAARGASADAGPGLPPIVVIVSEGRLTVASRDVDALDKFEELLETLRRGRRVSYSNGKFSMFLLQNADAKELADVLTSLFRRNSRSSRGGYGSSSRRRSSSVMIVADERMNALLVYGSSADRAAVEEMLDVLDSVDIPESLSTERPRMIPIKNLPARTILTVLTSVYKTQLSARRGLRPVTIPVGISPQMSSMLELLNATADSPLLTLDADETTNSIVMRAPRQLGEEIEEFIQELDEQAKDGGARNISLVPLRGMNAQQVEGALQLLMRGGRSRSRSSSYRRR